ncbi:MAG: flagellar biosynthetic protein FliO [Rubricoccaceae bacterium]
MSSLLASSPRPLGPRRRVVLFGGGLLLLWLALTLAPGGPPASPPVAERLPEAASRLPARPSAGVPAGPSGPGSPAAAVSGTAVSGTAVSGTAVSDGGRLAHVPTRPARSLLRPGNVLAVLLLAGGVAWAVYLRRRPDGPGAEDRPPALTSLAELPLGPGQMLRLVRVGEETLLLGLAQGSVTLLRRYAPGESPLPEVPVAAPVPAAPVPAAPVPEVPAPEVPAPEVPAPEVPASPPGAPAFVSLTPAPAPAPPRFADLLQHAVAAASR